MWTTVQYRRQSSRIRAATAVAGSRSVHHTHKTLSLYRPICCCLSMLPIGMQSVRRRVSRRTHITLNFVLLLITHRTIDEFYVCVCTNRPIDIPMEDLHNSSLYIGSSSSSNSGGGTSSCPSTLRSVVPIPAPTRKGAVGWGRRCPLCRRRTWALARLQLCTVHDQPTTKVRIQQQQQ